jgi:probable phosphoglycerate mutase
VTAETVLAASGRTSRPTLELDAGLAEISHGEWEGKLASEVERSHAELFETWRRRPSRELPAGPNAESLGDVETRAWAALERLAARLGDGTALGAAHDAVNRAIVCRVLGLPLSSVWRFRQAPATLNVLSGASLESLHLIRLNDAEHVAPLFAEANHRAL